MSRLIVSIGVCFVFVHLDLRIASGQEESGQRQDTTKTYLIDEVVVTATRTSKRLIDVPYSIDIIRPGQYRFERKTSIDNLLNVVPGLFFQNRYGNHDVRISIRGFGSRSNSGIRGVRILLDGIPESEPDGQTRIEAIDFHSIGSIEIVKGNSSSLYTNAPGGVINFINDIDFTESFTVNFNEMGSFALRSNGLKTGVKTDKYKFLTTYDYHTARGYRAHSEDNWHIINTVLESNPGDNSQLHMYGYFVDGLIRLPGSLTQRQLDADPFQANARDVSRDAKRITKKGRVGLQLNTFLDEDKNDELEVMGYGTIKYFERTAGTYRIYNRYGLGGSTKWVHHGEILDRKNEFSVGGDLFYQTGPIEEYQNINGKKGDVLNSVTDEAIGNVGLYFQNSLNIIEQKLDFLLTGRYDKVVFDNRNMILEVQNDTRRFEAFTPKVALSYKITPTVAAYTSFGFSFDSPAGNELDNYPLSSKPNFLLNPDLQAQKSRNFELGLKGNLLFPETDFFKSLYFDMTYFNSVIDDEIVPFEVFGDVFFRNSARTNRRGLELGTNVEVAKGLRWRTAYTFSDFKYDAYTARTIELDTSGSVVTLDRNFTGRVVPSVPRHNLSLSVSYEQKMMDHVTGFVKGNYVTVSGMYVDDANSERTGAYQVFNSTLGLDIVYGRFNVLFSGGLNNIFNKTYVAFINVNSASKDFYEIGEPQHYFAGVNLGYTF